MITSMENPCTPFGTQRGTATAHDLTQLPLLPGKGYSAHVHAQATLNELIQVDAGSTGPRSLRSLEHVALQASVQPLM